MNPANILALIELAKSVLDMIHAGSDPAATPEEIAAKRAAMQAHLKTANDLWEAAGPLRGFEGP